VAYAFAALAMAASAPEQALAWAVRAEELTPGPNLRALDARGTALAVLGRRDEAVTAWREAATAARQADQPQIAAQFEQKAAGLR
jgi:predicted negative regulator of RcsB-dependent stress response